MNWKTFFQSLSAAAIGGAATSVTDAMINPEHMEFTHLGPIAGAGALVGIAMFLKQPPAATPPKKKKNAAPPPTVPGFPENR